MGELPKHREKERDLGRSKTQTSTPFCQENRHIEFRRRLGQNRTFLPALKKALSKARKKLVAHNQDLEEDPTAWEDKDKAV